MVISCTKFYPSVQDAWKLRIQMYRYWPWPSLKSFFKKLFETASTPNLIIMRQTVYSLILGDKQRDLTDGSGVHVRRSFHYFTMNVSQSVSLCCSILRYPLHPSTQNDTNVCFWCPFFQMEFKLLLSRPFPTRLMCNKKASSKQSNLEGNYSF